MTALCMNCGRTIVKADAWGEYWYHPEGQTVYCNPMEERSIEESPRRAEPVRSVKRPTPVGVGRI